MTTDTSTLKVWTRNSFYELDHVNHRARRLTGRADPTPRQGPDGTWKTFVCMSHVTVGAPMKFVWSVDEFDGFAIERATVTSPVVGTDDGAVVG